MVPRGPAHTESGLQILRFRIFKSPEIFTYDIKKYHYIYNYDIGSCRGTEKQIEKNKRRATRLQRKVEALRKIDLDHICSQFSGLTDPPSTDAVEQALSEAVKSGDCSEAPSQAAADQQSSGLTVFLSVGVKGL